MPKRKKRTISETDLYGPIRDYLEAQGYTVRGEVNDCDIAAAKDGELIVIELKRSLSSALLVQATRRQRAADSVYVAIPRPKWGRRSHDFKHLLKRLELGLIFVSFPRRTPKVEVMFHPLPFQRKRKDAARRAILTEMAGRSGDYNEGGSTGRKIVTAYREQAIHIACCLDEQGPMSPRELRALGTGPKTQSILYSDYYGWFERIDVGVYSLRERGRSELGGYAEIAERYRSTLDSGAE